MIERLTPKQQRFVDEYLIDLNAMQAAIRAGYSRKSARAIACENLTKPDIQAAISEAFAARAERTGVGADRVVDELATLAFSSLTDVVEWDADGIRLRASSDLTPAQAATVRRVRVTSAEASVSLHEKVRALELLGKHLALFTERIEHDVHRLTLSELARLAAEDPRDTS